ncbi:MAG: MoaD/ThiS family protein [Nanoarchaeota archaeon]
MKVYIERTNKSVNANARSIRELLEKLNLNPTTVLVSINGEIVTEDKKLNRNDKITVHSVISGG